MRYLVYRLLSKFGLCCDHHGLVCQRDRLLWCQKCSRCEIDGDEFSGRQMDDDLSDDERRIGRSLINMPFHRRFWSRYRFQCPLSLAQR